MGEHTGGGVCQGPVRRGLTLRLLLLVLSMCHSQIALLMATHMVFAVKFTCVWVHNENGSKARTGTNLCGVLVK